MKFKKSVLIVVCTIIYGGILSAQSGPNPSQEMPASKGEISGKVVEENTDTPLEYTSVAVFSLEDSSLVNGTVTNSEGEFILNDVPFGEYYLEVQFVGYEKATISPVVVSRKSRTTSLGSLELSISTKSLEEVEIVADQRRVEYKIDKKVVNVSEDLTAAGGTAVDVLENTPSITVDIEGNVSLRGSSNFTVLINGKPTVLDAADALRQIPASNIQNIEIITNPSVKYDPDGNGGIVNVVLKKQHEKGTTGIINASVGVNNKYRADALINRRLGKFNYFIGGGWSDNLYDGTLQREQISFSEGSPDSYNVANGDFDFIRGGARIKSGFDYDFSTKSNLAFEVTAGTFRFGIDRSNNSHEYTDPATTDQYFVNTDKMIKDRLYYSGNLNFTQTFDTTAHKLVLMADYSRRNGEGTEESEYHEANENYDPLPVPPSFRNRNLETGIDNGFRFQADYTKPVGEGKIDAGYQLRYDQDDENFLFQQFDPDTETWMNQNEQSSGLNYLIQIQAAYIQYGGSINKLQIQAGLRGEYTYRLIEYDNFNTSYKINRFDLYPTLHMSRQFANDNQLMTSYSRRVNRPRSYFLDSIPSFIDKQTIRIGNPGLEPEYVNSYELGYQKGWGKNFMAFEAYYRNTRNLITRITDYNSEDEIFYQRFTNINQDHVIGSEVMLNWQFAKWLKMNASTNIYYYRIQGMLNGESIDNDNFSWRANANTTFNITPLTRFQLNAGYRGPSVTAQGRSEGMYYVNLALRQDFFKRKLSATVQVRDLFGSMRREFTATGENFSQYVLMQREPRVVMLSLSYKINNYRDRPENMGSGGGMDMDSGF
ncbi:MAG TPA: outer membrane beta-barrel family protein [Bacteroidales bacterium]|nr:outer membrane beta-barrel family protein [Bacteroidales bacterium]